MICRQGEQKYQKGEIIFREGVVPYGIFFIQQGKVKKYKVDASGREQIIYVANKGELIGYHAVLSEERYPDFAAAMEDSMISFIPKDDFLTATLNDLVQAFTMITFIINYLVFPEVTAFMPRYDLGEFCQSVWFLETNTLNSSVVFLF